MVRVPAKVRKEHEAKMALFDEAIKRAKAIEAVTLAMFSDQPQMLGLTEDAQSTINTALNGAMDMVTSLEGEKAFEEREFRLYGVDPYQRHLVANNID